MEETTVDTDKSDEEVEYNSDAESIPDGNEPIVEADQNPEPIMLDEDENSEVESDVDYQEEEKEIDIEGLNAPIIPEENVDSEHIMQIEDEDEDEDDTLSDDYNEYLQKFDNKYTNNILEEYHKEEFHINPDEMTKLCQIKKNTNGLIDDPLHKTSSIMSKYEFTNIIGVRAKQLGNGASPLIDIPSELIDNSIIAELELKQKVLPFVVKRPLGNGGCEFWRISDLEILL